MSSIIELNPYRGSNTIPILTFVDLQQEHLASPRALAIPGTDAVLENCRAALAHARIVGLPTAFVRWLGRSPFFNARFARWIDGFEPNPSDMIFDRTQLSCYSSREFGEIVDSAGGHLVLCGFAGEAACLSTLIDGHHRGHKITYLFDASASHGLDGIASSQVHEVVTRISALYGDVSSTASWIGRINSREQLVQL